MVRIHEQPMYCPTCGHECILDDCIIDCDGDGSFGCPMPDCGTVMEMKREELSAMIGGK